MNTDSRCGGPLTFDLGTFGEDLAGNFRDIVGIAERLCSGCAAYHVGFVARRAANPGMSVAVDRQQMVTILRRLLPRAGGTDDIHVVIAGASDSGILATCAGGAFLAGRSVQDRVRYTAIDRCGTPLELCRRYATRNGITFSSIVADVLGSRLLVAADVVVVHSLLRHIPRERHGELLGVLCGWLKPDAFLLMTHGLRSGNESGRRRVADERLRWLIGEGRVDLPESPDALLGRLASDDRARTEYSGSDELLDLFASSPLEVLEVSSVEEKESVDANAALRRRILLVARNRRIPETEYRR